MKYMVVKNVSISSPLCKKKYKKDDIFTHEDFSVNDIERLLFLKYIKVLNESKHTNEEYLDLNTLDSNNENKSEDEEIDPVQVNSNSSDLPYYLMPDKYLTAEQVENLDKSQLLEYCEDIGVTGYKQNSSVKYLRELINEFIESAN